MTTPRERVLLAVNHRPPDRIPIDLSGHRSSGIMAIAYHNLKQHLGITTGDIYVYDFVQQLAIVEPEILDRFQVDTIELGRGFALKEEDWRDWVLPDGTPCKIPAFINPVNVNGDWHIYDPDGTLTAIQKAGSLYFEQTCFPLLDYAGDNFDHLPDAMNKVMWASLGSPPAPIEFDETGLAQITAGVKKLRQSTDRAIIGLFGGNFMEWGQFLFRMDNFLMLLAAEPRCMHKLLDKLLEIHLDNLRKFLSAVGPYIDIILFGDDLGMQNGPQVSPRMYRKFFFPRHRELWQTAKSLSNAKVMLHSCGSVAAYIPMFIEAGLDILQPVQTSAYNMDAAYLKREYGRDLCLWGGGCDTQKMLPQGTPEEVAQDVRSRVEILSPGGGFVFQQVHNIMADIPPENIVAMLDAVNP
ncbi:MAG: uroporphyrinogen decarboxylase family protein [Anaerolineae bacterium]|nr:uroporphyrinogen decarboxylase family protein [Anaerolineae bacterium]